MQGTTNRRILVGRGWEKRSNDAILPKKRRCFGAINQTVFAKKTQKISFGNYPEGGKFRISYVFTAQSGWIVAVLAQ
jgi:hypothetical protein